MFNALEQLRSWFTTSAWWGYVIRITCFYALAWIGHRLRWRMAGRLVRLSRFSASHRRPRPERQNTMRSLLASAISLIAFVTATFFSLGQFVKTDTLVWMVGLFSAAFGLGARPLLSDVLSGISFLFEDTIAVGEKVEITGIEGVIEAVNLRTTWLRSPNGELSVVPNGEVRVVRNFSRGRFSPAHVTLKIATADLGRALPLLETLSTEAVSLLPNLLEPWQVISESGRMGQQTELTLLAKARFGKAAEIRTRLLALVQDRLAEAGIALAN